MSRILKTLLLAGPALALGSIAPLPGYSAETLAMLDPSARAAGLCGGGRAGEGLRARLTTAASVLGAQAVAAAPLYEGLGETRFRITTASADAQRYFDQGLTLTYGFNHAGAIRAFKQAQALDPNCAMCWWGEAFAHGPNINAPMDAGAIGPALEAVRQAQRLAGSARPDERALITAIARRYSADPASDRSALDAAYAAAMLDAARAHPASDELAVLAAEAAMETSPWDYFEADKRTAKGRLGEAVSLVETVLARNPDHPQAAHLYIHLMENSADPRRAEAAADRLAKPLVPGAGHLVHMPAHIYYRLGRYRDSIRANVEAARVDEEYLRRSGESGMYRYGYYPHNVHFIVASAQMAGDLPTAVREARRLEKVLSPEVAAKIGWIQSVQAAPYLAVAQRGSPEQVLAMTEPAGGLPYVRGMRHYARAVARAQQRNRAEFDRELGALRTLRQTADFSMMTGQGVPAPDLLALAERVAEGRWAMSARRYDEAAQLFRQAAAIEAKIPYMEPPYWYYPVQQSLGAALYQAGRYEDARAAFNAALVQAPNNGWALYGLTRTERALGHRPEAAAADAALRKAWVGDPRWLRMERL